MAEFLSPLRVEKCADGRWKLLEPLAFYSAKCEGVFIAPAGFVTDLASTPRFVWSVYPKDGPWVRAAVMHDAGYEHQLLTVDMKRVHLIKPIADELFVEGLEAEGVHPINRAILGAAVRVFGKGHTSQAHLDAEKDANG